MAVLGVGVPNPKLGALEGAVVVDPRYPNAGADRGCTVAVGAEEVVGPPNAKLEPLVPPAGGVAKLNAGAFCCACGVPKLKLIFLLMNV